MKTYKVIVLINFFIFMNTGVTAQKVLRVWPEKIPGSIENNTIREVTDTTNKAKWTTGVTKPTLTIFMPAKEKLTGAAVVICPGGGYAGLAIGHEGYEIGEYFKNMGVVGIVLKYRLPNDAIMKDKKNGPLQDVQEAIRIARRHANEWGIDPNKIGVMGFSAGGHLASTASTLYNEKIYEVKDSMSARPDFSILIYPVISLNAEISHGGSRDNLLGKNVDQKMVEHFSNELQVNANTPQAFLVHSTDDDVVPVQNSIIYLMALKKNKVVAELHIYETGGHGYGLGISGTESAWPEALKNWMKAKGLL